MKQVADRWKDRARKDLIRLSVALSQSYILAIIKGFYYFNQVTKNESVKTNVF